MREAFALQKFLTYFQQKILELFQILTIWNFNETLTNNIVSFEPPGPDLHCLLRHFCSNI